jgi:hypothetical protein
MDEATSGEETVEQLGDRFPELDDAARRRAAVSAAAGTDAHAALAHESVVLHLVRAYN